jgi:hypothetical protein
MPSDRLSARPMNAIPNRRGLLLGVISAGAVATVGAMPTIAAAEAPDPVFGRIEALKTAEARIDGLRDLGDQATYEEACQAADAAFDELMETPPVTIPGMRALLEFLDEWCGGNNGNFYDYSLLLRSPILAPKETRP